MSGTEFRSGAQPVRSDDAAHHRASASAQTGAQSNHQPMRAWPVLLLALPAFVAIWSGWVGLGQLTGFGPVHPLPGIADSFTINTAITLPIGMEAYASYALYVWLGNRIRSEGTRRYAKYSAFGSLILGAVGQIAYHLMQAAKMNSAPWPVTVLVACLPVGVLGMGAALAHMILREHHDTDDVRTTDPESALLVRTGAERIGVDPEPVRGDEPVHRVSVREVRTETYSQSTALTAQPSLPEIEPAQRTTIEPEGAQDRWAQVAESVCGADPAGRRDPEKVATILRLKFEQQWSHSRIAEHVELSPSAVTRTVTAAKELTANVGLVGGEEETHPE